MNAVGSEFRGVGADTRKECKPNWRLVCGTWRIIRSDIVMLLELSGCSASIQV